MSAGTAIRLALSQIKVRCIYRVGPTGVTVTTPDRPLGPLHTGIYDIRNLATKASGGDAGAKAAQIVKTLLADCDLLPETNTGADGPTIQVLNGTQLVVHASAAAHDQVVSVLDAQRRLGDLSVVVHAKLYEVDDAFHTRLKKIKRVPLEELEQRFLAGDAPPSDLFKSLEKQAPVQSGDEAKASDGEVVTLLSRHAVVTCLPDPSAARKGSDARQVIFAGVSLFGAIRVSPDRRAVHLTLTEKAAQIEEIQKSVVLGLFNKQLLPPEMLNAEVPFIKESTTTRLLEIPDGGALLVAVQYRPRALAAKNRWWVLAITPRIIIEEEEQAIRQNSLDAILPALAADVLNNPRLKTTREFYGSPGDKRFALIPNPAVAWPKNMLVPGFQLTKAEPAGKRLLGLRVDEVRDAEGKKPARIAVTLLNAGGSANGAVVGGGTIRYTARPTETGYAVELVEGPGR
jgi:hypothetical protein